VVSGPSRRRSSRRRVGGERNLDIVATRKTSVESVSSVTNLTFNPRNIRRERRRFSGGREKYGPFDVDVITLTLYFDYVEEVAAGTFWCVRTRLRLRSLWRRICHPHSKAKLINFSESYWR